MTGREGEPRLAGAAQTNFEAVSGMPQPDCPMTIVQTALMSHGTCACITRCLLHVARVPCVLQCSDRRSEIKFRKVRGFHSDRRAHDAVLPVQTADGSGAAGVPGEVTERGFDCHRPAHSRRKLRDVSACIHRTVRLQRKLVALHRAPRVCRCSNRRAAADRARPRRTAPSTRATPSQGEPVGTR